MSIFDLFIRWIICEDDLEEKDLESTHELQQQIHSMPHALTPYSKHVAPFLNKTFNYFFC